MKLLLTIFSLFFLTQICLSDTSYEEDLQQRITRVLESKQRSIEDELYEQRLNQFRHFVVEFGKKYDSDSEIELRFEAFRKNMDTHDYFVKNEQGTAEYGMTRFSDMMGNELRRQASDCSRPAAKLSADESFVLEQLVEVGNEVQNALYQYQDLPKEVDWRAKGLISPVLDQGYCASAWAYAATTALETEYAQVTGKFQRLSKQQLIDCDGYNAGCCGGYSHLSYLYLARAGGLELDKTYNGRPFVRRCHYNRENGVAKVYGISLFTNASVSANEAAIEKYVATHGPVVVSLTAKSLTNYKGGIIKQGDTQCKDSSDWLAHTVTLVGYGEENGTKYWIGKNSWGKKWGEKGYFRIQRGKNMCGIASYGVAPIAKPPKTA